MSGSTKNRFIKEAGGSGLLYHTHGHPVDGKSGRLASTSHPPPLLEKTLTARLPEVPDALQLSFPEICVGCACDPTRSNTSRVHSTPCVLYTVRTPRTGMIGAG